MSQSAVPTRGSSLHCVAALPVLRCCGARHVVRAWIAGRQVLQASNEATVAQLVRKKKAAASPSPSPAEPSPSGAAGNVRLPPHVVTRSKRPCREQRHSYMPHVHFVSIRAAVCLLSNPQLVRALRLRHHPGLRLRQGEPHASPILHTYAYICQMQQHTDILYPSDRLAY